MIVLRPRYVKRLPRKTKGSLLLRFRLLKWLIQERIDGHLRLRLDVILDSSGRFGMSLHHETVLRRNLANLLTQFAQQALPVCSMDVHLSILDNRESSDLSRNVPKIWDCSDNCVKQRRVSDGTRTNPR